jgi:transcriptional regulator with XRE-family HTH domain
VESISLRARWLGQLVRRLRDDQGLTLKFVAAHLGVEFGVVSRFERGEAALTRDHVIALLDAYRLHDAQERALVLELAQQAWQAQGRLDFEGVIPDQAFADVLWLESQAAQILCYNPAILPDLLCTVDYATHEHPDAASPDQVAAWARLAEQRQQVIRREPHPPEILVVLDEPVLGRRVGDLRVWRDQLDHLAGLAQLPNLRLRVLTSGAVRPAGVGHGFTVFTLPAPYSRPVVHIPYLGGRLLLEEHADQYLAALDRLDQAAVDGGAFISKHTQEG